MLLTGKNAIIYGGGGSVGSAVAHAFTREGARVFLAGRTLSTLEKADVPGADLAVVDATDREAVEEHAAYVAAQGDLHISMNVISDTDIQGTPMTEMTLDDYIRPVITAVSSKFLTATAAARHMRGSGGGVILNFGGSVDRGHMRDYNFGGIQVTFDAVESMRRQLAVELAPHGIRVITLRTGGIADTIPTDYPQRDVIVGHLDQQTLLGYTASLADVGNVAAFAASDMARTITGTEINMTCGASLD
jgi:NAD(P)-dependent dehydrogenase (short-subunit alcohol dehydrogenase family)